MVLGLMIIEGERAVNAGQARFNDDTPRSAVRLSMPNEPAASSRPDDSLDPVFVHARREAILILGLYALCFLWAIPVCWLGGYLGAGEETTEISTVLGVPSWTFWGIAAPWIAVDIFTVWFCFFHMKEDDLGEEVEAKLDDAPERGDAPDA